MAPAQRARADTLFLAKLAEEAERYDDVVKYVREIAFNFDGRLTVDERSLLSVAYKNITNALRNSWRVVDAAEKMESSSRSKKLGLVRRQKERIELQLVGICNDLMDLLDARLVTVARLGEETVFYLKMKADYFRYLAEFSVKADRDRFAESSLSAYKLAYKHALSKLEPTHPTRLGLALNFSVYYHDVFKSPERASHLAKHAFDEAVQFIKPDEPAESLRDSLMILQLLRDDLVLWANEM